MNPSTCFLAWEAWGAWRSPSPQVSHLPAGHSHPLLWGPAGRPDAARPGRVLRAVKPVGLKGCSCISRMPLLCVMSLYVGRR